MMPRVWVICSTLEESRQHFQGIYSGSLMVWISTALWAMVNGVLGHGVGLFGWFCASILTGPSGGTTGAEEAPRENGLGL